jgi:hypothetical protein
LREKEKRGRKSDAQPKDEADARGPSSLVPELAEDDLRTLEVVATSAGAGEADNDDDEGAAEGPVEGGGIDERESARAVDVDESANDCRGEGQRGRRRRRKKRRTDETDENYEGLVSLRLKVGVCETVGAEDKRSGEGTGRSC